MNAIVKIKYEDYLKVKSKILSLKSKPVLYCLTFKHGLMKVGKTTNIVKRLEALCAHGLLRPLVEDIILVRLENVGALSCAEQIALSEISKFARKLEKEVFEKIDLKIVLSILNVASKKAQSSKLLRPKPTPDQYMQIAKESGLWDVLVGLANEERVKRGMSPVSSEIDKSW
ncbi:GIY-YIG nuclease family protein [Acinetobacter bereziniae]|uniref:GIY-YIG nuclease family protein n=1 Tax=Acinetobacter bereziniae TaxID=106648 RepID=UPI00124FA286|nr:GIY-YIG nuclease family protein [Acinetobacter bereziniae]